MKDSSIPSDIRMFIDEYIGSAQQLDVLLLVASEASKSWTIDEIAKELGVNPSSVGNRLINLWAKGLVRVVDEGPPRTYRFIPVEMDLVAVVRKLAAAYKKQRAQILSYLDSNEDEREAAKAIDL